MNGFEERKIGDVVFLVFADGMVSAADVLQIRRDPDGFCIAIRGSGWLMLKPLS